MKKFLDDNFLLDTDTASELYHNYAKTLAIIDFHSHLDPLAIAADRQFSNLIEAWIEGDHYKWRAMRACGVSEQFITGDADDREKFRAWAGVVPYVVRNPLYHWTHMELKRYFGIDDLLGPGNCDSVYDKCGAMLSDPDYSVRGLLERMNVEVLCTTDDPLDDLSAHKKIAGSDFDMKVLPAWRPDRVLEIEKAGTFNSFIDKLEDISGIRILSAEKLLDALDKRHAYFHEAGCRLADHGIREFYADSYSANEIEAIFSKSRERKGITGEELNKFKSFLLHELALMNNRRGWVQQYHYGVIRNNNTRLFNKLGPDTGFDSIGCYNVAEAMGRFFDRLDSSGNLAKTIIYNINPSDNEMVASMAGSFNDGSLAGKMQFGAAWWFMDSKRGIERQLNTLSDIGLISRFVGMLTDSRSFLSYPRHEYFRRILCNLFGSEIEKGELPADKDHIGKIIQDICYFNAREYFGF